MEESKKGKLLTKADASLSATVKVVIRTRPTSNFASQSINISQESSEVGIKIPRNADEGFVNNQQENWKFKFNKIMHNASQEDIYEFCVRDVV